MPPEAKRAQPAAGVCGCTAPCLQLLALEAGQRPVVPGKHARQLQRACFCLARHALAVRVGWVQRGEDALKEGMGCSCGCARHACAACTEAVRAG